MIVAPFIANLMLVACGGGGTSSSLSETPNSISTPAVITEQVTASTSPDLFILSADSLVTNLDPSELQVPAEAAAQAPTIDQTAAPIAQASSQNEAGSPTVRPLAVPATAMATATGLSASAPSVLPGTGLTSRLAAGCTPRLANDFIDSTTWNSRRLMPRDCLQARTNPPIFSWKQPTNRDTTQPWSFVLRHAGNGAVEMTSNSVAPRLSLHRALPADKYEWTVSYTTQAGVKLTSEPRRFAVGADAPVVVYPTGTAFAATVIAKAHPRVQPTGATFDAIGAAARTGNLAPAYADLIATANLALTTALPAAPESSDASSQSYSIAGKLDSVALQKALDQEQRFIEALGYAARFTADQRYATAGVQRALGLARWSPMGVTSESNLDYANRFIYLGLAQALDLFSADLTLAQTNELVAVLKIRLAQTRARFEILDANPFDSHVDVLVWSVLQALLHTAGTNGFDEAPVWLAETWALLLTSANAWGADDGGFGNGVAYAWYRLDYIAQTLAAIRVIGGVDFARHPSIMGLGDYLVAFTAPMGQHRGAFGDAAEVTTHYSNYAANQFRVYATLTGSPLHAWYWQAGSSTVRKNQRYSPWLLMLLGLNVKPVTGQLPALNSWPFEDAGVVAMHSASSAPNRSSVFFRASEYGSWVHSHADQNSFVLVSKGKDLLISGGHFPYFLSPHHATVTRATRYKNALTFDGGIGQAEASISTVTAPGKPLESRDARGLLLNYGDNGNWGVTTGDATLAYRSYDSSTYKWTPLLSDATRSVAYNRNEKVLVVYDYAASATPRRWELNFNALSAFAASGNTAQVSNGDAAACIDVYGSKGAFATSKGFAIAPENGAADQYQARFSVASKSAQLVAVTVIREDCRSVPVAVSIVAGTGASVSINGSAAIQFDRKSVTMP